VKTAAGTTVPAALATLTATALALTSLPAGELPRAWLLAFTAPGAVLGVWRGQRHRPWLRAVVAVYLQAAACWLALEHAGPMSRAAALACTILPPLAFAAVRREPSDHALALFLAFCTLLVGTILGGMQPALVLGFAAAAAVALRVAARTTALEHGQPPLRTATTAAFVRPATPGIVLACVAAVFAIDRALQALPSPARQPDSGAGSSDTPRERRPGLDDSFVLDGKSGLLGDLRGEQLVRVVAPGGEQVPANLYLRCGFFAVPGLDRWQIGALELEPATRTDGHDIRRPLPFAEPRTLRVERFEGATSFVFLPPGSIRVDGLRHLATDNTREWLRPLYLENRPYEVTFQDLPDPPADLPLDPRAGRMGLLTVPRALDRPAYEALLLRWRVGQEPLAAMRALAEGLRQHCRYDRSEPEGPYPHALENFLFADGDRHGYCMHFASAAALLLRLRGIPARIGVGLYGGDADRGRPEARAYGSQHAHAWVEVPFAGRGYVVFDPTPPELRGRGEAPGNEPNALAAPAAPDTGAGAVDPWLERLSRPWILAAVLLALLGFAAWPRGAPRPPSERVPATVRGATGALRRLLRELARHGHRRGARQTIESFARDLAARNALLPEIAAAFVAYQEVRFGGRVFDAARERVLRQACHACSRLAPPQSDATAGHA
jgi:transglutaminase-like putative cysteine protease